MNLVELDRALRQLRLSGMAAVLETRLRQAQTEKMAPLDLVSALVTDELRRRQDRLLERRHKLARFRDPERSLDTFDCDFNKKMNPALVYDLATAHFIAQREDVLFLGPPGTGKSHLAKRSAAPRFSKGIASSTARPSRCSKNWPSRRSPVPAKTTSRSWRRCHCSSSIISACASWRTPRPRTSSN